MATTSNDTDAGEVEGETTELRLTLPDGETATPLIERVAGENAFGQRDIEDPEAVEERLDNYEQGQPAIIGGGGNLSGQPTDTLGWFEEYERDGDNISVTIDAVHRLNRPLRRDTVTRTLGSWVLMLPVGEDDADELAKAMEAHVNGETEFFAAAEREQAKKIASMKDEFMNLAPGDTIQTKPYSTDLAVMSGPVETHVGQSRIRGGMSYTEATGVTVSNPRGGFYTLAMEATDTPTEAPTLYISNSNNAPPSPNEPFMSETAFRITDFEVVEKGATDVDVVEPDEEIRKSPLAPSQLRPQIADIDGVGETTQRKMFKAVGTSDAHQIALLLFGDPSDEEAELAGISDMDADDAREVIDTLPRKADVYDELQRMYNEKIAT